MKKANLIALAFVAQSLAACEATPPPETPPTPPPAPVETAAVTPPPADTAKPAEPTPEEKKKAEEEKKKAEAAAQLAADRAEFEAAHKAETARWTPALRAEAKKLTGKTYPAVKVAFTSVLKSKIRKPGNAERDKDRHPLETLDFLGVKPGMSVLEFGPGEGWYTEILAPTLAAKGKLFITSGDPNGPPEARGTFYAERTKRSLEVAPELFGKVERVVVDNKDPHFNMDGQLDVVLLFRGMHGLHNNKQTAAVLAEIYKALKPGGVLGIEQHRANADANPDEASKKGYLPEAFVIQQVEAAGFKLADKSEINANAKDTKDYEEGVWALPPTLRNKDKERAKYVAIGESDRMTLKFVKPKKEPKKGKK
ncbi:MAG: methyltransferase domain-containing protein [Minicystis sp.]